MSNWLEAKSYPTYDGLIRNLVEHLKKERINHYNILNHTQGTDSEVSENLKESLGGSTIVVGFNFPYVIFDKKSKAYDESKKYETIAFLRLMHVLCDDYALKLNWSEPYFDIVGSKDQKYLGKTKKVAGFPAYVFKLTADIEFDLNKIMDVIEKESARVLRATKREYKKNIAKNNSK